MSANSIHHMPITQPSSNPLILADVDLSKPHSFKTDEEMYFVGESIYDAVSLQLQKKAGTGLPQTDARWAKSVWRWTLSNNAIFHGLFDCLNLSRAVEKHGREHGNPPKVRDRVFLVLGLLARQTTADDVSFWLTFALVKVAEDQLKGTKMWKPCLEISVKFHRQWRQVKHRDLSPLPCTTASPSPPNSRHPQPSRAALTSFFPSSVPPSSSLLANTAFVAPEDFQPIMASVSPSTAPSPPDPAHQRASPAALTSFSPFFVPPSSSLLANTAFVAPEDFQAIAPTAAPSVSDRDACAPADTETVQRPIRAMPWRSHNHTTPSSAPFVPSSPGLDQDATANIAFHGAPPGFNPLPSSPVHTSATMDLGRLGLGSPTGRSSLTPLPSHLTSTPARTRHSEQSAGSKGRGRLLPTGTEVGTAATGSASVPAMMTAVESPTKRGLVPSAAVEDGSPSKRLKQGGGNHERPNGARRFGSRGGVVRKKAKDGEQRCR